MADLFEHGLGTTGRPFEKSHPWITFELKTARFPVRLWLALGEARSKCDHLAGVPLNPDVAQKLHFVFLAKGVHATAAIEGNTLSEQQVLARVEGKASTVPQSQQYLAVEIDNVLNVANAIAREVEVDGPGPITPEIIQSYNRRILENLECEDHVAPGEYRKSTVGVNDYKAPAWEDCPYLVERLCDWLNSSDFKSDQEDEVIVNGIIRSIVAHIYIAWIHPFGDGNGRTARALEVRFLMEAGVPSSAGHLLSNHYNQTRAEYYRRLQEASRNGGDITNFIAYAVHGLKDQLRAQLVVVRAQQWSAAWQNYIYQRFGTDKTAADKRQILLLLALSETDNAVPVNRLRRLTPELAEMYAKKTAKTLTRDINRLVELGLAAREEKGIRACREIILAFLPRMVADKRRMLIDHGLRMKEEAGQLGIDALALLEPEAA
jgi:Fic family protein